MQRKNVLKLPRNLQLLLYILKHEGVCASELVNAGFTKPGVYALLGALCRHELIRAEPFEVKTPHGLRLRRVFHLTDRGKTVASHLVEVEKIVGQRFTGREHRLE